MKPKPTWQKLRKFALELPGAYEDHPWGETVVRVGKKAFVFMGTGDPQKLVADSKAEAHRRAMITASERQQIQEQYSAVAAVYAKFESPRTRAQVQPLLDELPLEAANRALDIGTGPGPVIEAIRERGIGSFVAGIDLASAMLQEAARRTDAHLLTMDATALAFRDEAFDSVLFSHVLLHLPRPEQGLIEARRVLRPGGHLGVASFKDDPRTTARAGTVIDELLDEWKADHLQAMPRFEKEGVSEKEIAEMVQAAGLAPLRYWTQQFHFRIEKPSEEILGKSALRIGSLCHGKAAEFRERAEAVLADLPDEDFDFERTAMYVVAQK